MGEVYLARDTKLGRKVALKVVRPEPLGSPEAVERFLFEARTTARFNHPHIVTIHARGRAPGPALRGAGVPRGPDPARADGRASGSACSEAMRFGLAIAEALRGGPPPQGAAPGPQAGERDAPAGRPAARGGLRPGQGPARAPPGRRRRSCPIPGDRLGAAGAADCPPLTSCVAEALDQRGRRGPAARRPTWRPSSGWAAAPRRHRRLGPGGDPLRAAAGRTRPYADADS